MNLGLFSLICKVDNLESNEDDLVAKSEVKFEEKESRYMNLFQTSKSNIIEKLKKFSFFCRP